MHQGLLKLRCNEITRLLEMLAQEAVDISGD